MAASDPRQVHPVVVRLSSYAWRLLVIVAALVAILWFLGQIRVTLVALVVATLLSRALMPVGDLLRRRGLPPAASAAGAILAFLVGFGLVMTLIGFAVVDQSEDIGPTVSEALDDVEEWIVEDSPFDIDQRELDRIRSDLGSDLGSLAASSSDGILSGVLAAFEVVFGVILGLVLTFFMVKDGRRFGHWFVSKLPEERRAVTLRMAQRGWDTIGGYLRGAAILGLVEGTIIAITLQLVGAELAVPMGVLTFIGAFIPFLGAVFAGILAVLVTLTTAGFAAAVTVAVVAVVVQQLDNDLLAPWIYGQALSLHPVVVLLAITTGGSLFGLAGSFLAVPVVAVAINVWVVAREDDGVAELLADDR